MKSLLTGVVFLVLFLNGCGRRERMELDNLEQLSAATIAKFLSFYESQHPDVQATNVAQVFALMDLKNAGRTHPYVLQQRFRAFGEKSGFTNSIYEKYVPVSRGMTNHSIAGELVFISAEPFSDLNRDVVRMVIWKAGKQDYRVGRLEERQIQEIFRQASFPIPQPLPTPPPEAPANDQKLTYPLATQIRIFFEDLAYHYGPGRFFWLPTMLLCGFVVLAIVIFLYIWFGHRRRD